MTIRYILKSKLDSFDQFTMVIMISKIIIDNLLQLFHCFWGSTSDICFDNRPEIKIKHWIWVRDQEPTRALFRWQWRWWHRYVGHFMMVTDFRSWWQNHYVGDLFSYVEDFLNVLNRSPISWFGHQHPKLVTNKFVLQHPLPTSM